MKKLNVRVEQMLSAVTAKPVRSQFVITTPQGNFFQSYQTIVAFRANDGSYVLDPAWDCSRTTLKYLKLFMGDEAACADVIRKRISAGMYALEELN